MNIRITEQDLGDMVRGVMSRLMLEGPEDNLMKIGSELFKHLSNVPKNMLINKFNFKWEDEHPGKSICYIWGINGVPFIQDDFVPKNIKKRFMGKEGNGEFQIESDSVKLQAIVGDAPVNILLCSIESKECLKFLNSLNVDAGARINYVAYRFHFQFMPKEPLSEGADVSKVNKFLNYLSGIPNEAIIEKSTPKENGDYSKRLTYVFTIDGEPIIPYKFGTGWIARQLEEIGFKKSWMISNAYEDSTVVVMYHGKDDIYACTLPQNPKLEPVLEHFKESALTDGLAHDIGYITIEIYLLV